MQPGVSDSPSLGKGGLAPLKYVGSEGVPSNLTLRLRALSARPPTREGQSLPEHCQC